MADESVQTKPRKLTADEAEKARRFVLSMIEKHNIESVEKPKEEKPKIETPVVELIKVESKKEEPKIEKKVIEQPLVKAVEIEKTLEKSEKKTEVNTVVEEKKENKEIKEIIEKAKEEPPADYQTEVKNEETSIPREKEMKIIEERIMAIRGVEREIRIRDEVLEQDISSLNILKGKLEKLQTERNTKRKAKRNIKIVDLILVGFLIVLIVIGVFYFKIFFEI